MHRNLSLLSLFIIGLLPLHAATETRNVGSFTKLSASTGVNVILIASDHEAVIVNVDNAATALVTTKNNDGTLRIGLNPTFDSDISLSVTVYYKTLTFIDVITGAEVTCKNSIESPMLRIRATLGGRINVRVAGGLLKASANQGSSVVLTGKCEFLEAKAGLNGTIGAFDLVAQNAQVNASTGAKIKVHVINNLQASSTAATIEYTGTPVLSEKKSLGGVIKSVNNEHK